MFVIIDWTDTQVIGVFNSREYAEAWLKRDCEKTGKEWEGCDHHEVSIHKIINADDAEIRWDA